MIRARFDTRHRPDFDPQGILAAARDRLPLPWRRAISQFSRTGRGTLLRRTPGLHPGLDLIPWHAFAAMFERSEAAGVLGQHVRRPGSGASVAHGFERWRQRLISGRKIGQQFATLSPRAAARASSNSAVLVST